MHPNRIAAILTLVVAGLSLPMAQVQASSGSKVVLPLSGSFGPSGLKLAVDSTWAEGCGYRPVRFEVTCAAPAPGERTLSIEMQPFSWGPRAAVVTALEIPAGALTASKTISVPQWQNWYSFKLEVGENDLRIPELSQTLTMSVVGNGQEGVPSILFVGSAMPDVTALSALPIMGGAQPQNASLHDCLPADLPSRWLDYHSLDIVSISLADLEMIAAQRPAVWQSLRRWNCAGGNLWVFGAGQDWEGLSKLDTHLDQSAAAAETDGTSRWQPADIKLRGEILAPLPMDPQDGAVAAEVDAAAKPTPPPEKPPFQWRDVELGRVVALADDKPLPGNATDLAWLFNVVGPERWGGVQRQGASMHQANPDFWTLLIPDVGLAPVDAYRVLITLFVVLIGPVNYWMLRRANRLHLLLFTVPASAALVAGSLFAYALASDGLSLRARVRSFTALDQRSGEAVCWSRLSYYAGLAPSKGLKFSADTAVTPLRLFPEYDYRGGPPARTLVWDGDQYLTRGWLSSRTPTQFVNLRCRKSPASLHVMEPETGSAELGIENRLGCSIDHLLVCSGDGSRYYGQNIAAGDHGRCKALDEAQADGSSPLDGFRAALAPNTSNVPPAAQQQNSYRGSVFGLRQHIYYSFPQAGKTPSPSTSRLEVSLENARAALSTGGKLEPRTYLAIVDRSPEVELGVDGASERESLHVILGKW